MDRLTEHYRQLLQLDQNWQVDAVRLLLEEKRLEIDLRHQGKEPVICAQCGARCGIADHAPERSWRHLDTMQFETRLRARVPRSKCGQCGVKTVAVPWAEKHSRFTLMFEAFVIQVLLAASNLKRAGELLGVDWESLQRIMEQAVKRGEARLSLIHI